VEVRNERSCVALSGHRLTEEGWGIAFPACAEGAVKGYVLRLLQGQAKTPSPAAKRRDLSPVLSRTRRRQSICPTAACGAGGEVKNGRPFRAPVDGRGVGAS
jgi:hypothetical protein